MFKDIQMFIIKLYSKNPNIASVNILRGLLASSSTIANLPPTEDALRFHCLRAYYQTKVWLNGLEPCPKLPCIADYGWKIDKDGNVNPVLTTLPSFPLHLNVLASCGCKKDCGSKVCSCKKSNIGCIWSCKCMAQKTCKNRLTKTTDLPQFDEESDLDE
ncbi:uncharacterized protein LOC108915871 [Anoplophora glabripennis]|uniref:uncharacterized protein LOC108915871 n=1 Tax=Anoplophora glabripennis TaxID=217634 RepID=UPI000874C367|nr:uncharacterized protein LOC108915871 [Anoplophora glabripennis]